MRIARVTYKGAYHHIMSRGLNGKDIYLDDRDKIHFQRLLEEKAGIYGIPVFAYTIMPNHYHLAICNRSGRMSDMMRVLNGGYASFFRTKHGGKGYLFQDRFRSTLVENRKYLWRVVQYALINPSVAGICSNPFNYKWSSISCYFSAGNTFVDTSLVESLFENKGAFTKAIDEYQYRKLEERESKFGFVLGGPKFEGIISQEFNRRKSSGILPHAHMRRGEKGSSGKHSKEQIINGFKAYFEINNLGDFLLKSGHASKRKVDMLIKLLRDEGDMSYREVSQELGLRFSSLGHRYKRAKERGIPLGLKKQIRGKE